MVHAVATAAPLPVDEIAAICRRHRVTELAVFGSILGAAFRPESDVDFLARFKGDDLGPWMSRLAELEPDLATLLGRKVNVVDWLAIEQSRNPYRRHGILSGRKLLYAA